MASSTLVPLVPSTLVPKTKASSVLVPKKNSGLSVGYAIGAAIVLRSQAGPRVRVGKSKSSGSYPFEPLGFRGPRFVCSANIRAGINETCQRSVGTYEFLSPCRSVSLQSLGFDSSWESPYGLLSNTRLRALVNEDTGDKETHPGRRESLGLWERMSLALHPVMCILRDIEMFLRENVKGITIAASIAIALGVGYFFLKLTAISSLKSVPYSDLVTGLQEGAVTTVLFEEGSSNIYWDTKSWLGKSEIPSSIAQAGNMIARKDLLQNPGEVLSQMLTKLKNTIASTHLWEYSTRMVDIDEYYLLTLLKQKGIEYSSAPRSIFMSVKGALDPGLKTMGTYLVTYCLPVWISMLPIVWVQMNQFSSFNKPAKKRKPSNQKASFQDVEGVDTAKAELTEVVSCLQNAYIYKKVGAKLPRGVLLVGPPGTGKTLLARAVAGEAGVPVFIASASEFVEVFVGRGASRIRDLFNEARKKAPSIIFIDELDAVGGKRGRNSFNSEQEQTLNQLLTEMDGFDSDMKVIVIAATNRPETLDPALLRPGRFSRKVFVGEPDEDGRRKILAVHMRGYSFEEDKNVICSLIASLTPGMTGANLANIINEAALLAARRGREKVSSEDFMEAIEREKCGINDKEGTTSRMGRNDSGQDGSSGMAMHGPLGIPNLSWAN